mmetsp:Transcript_33961/g.56167  ORF Transcript_33961/g.56167 Transcript_33961/m.56167 type:complete len:461 (-) Transcript_33961:310-1692(-)|eukprot:CAMPEP_0119317296 /NCGR_PEP_ID=MMETSP1333-20130426/42690_1 /TAXON_ID=418940 /ORGANISM="Scyphosphaera apsteinii, Strain RCC1455" /LENGTH=460 /DNA_ID=CAMNT_0007323191 /DNA_START=86 /DNA_END=1468 /DNA_ORIENTATION=-
MISDDVTRIELESRKRALEEYKLRCQGLRAENDGLKAEKDQREMDALQIISFLRRDAERKDELIESLKSTITQQRDVFAQQREQETEATNTRFNDMEEKYQAEASERQRHIDAIERELRELQEFKEQKAFLEETMQKSEQARHDMAEEHAETVAAMERKFFEEKGRLQKEYKQMLAEMKKTSQEEAVERLDASTKKILFENRRMAEELRLQVTETDDLQKSKRTLEEENKKLKREVQLNEQSVKEYAKQGFRQSKEIKDLSAKVKSLERYVSSSTREFEKEKDAITQFDRRKMAEMELDSAGLRQLVKIKTKELNNVKKLAALILQKRNEVETFLLESIEHVKGEVSRQRAEDERAGKRNPSKGRLPALAGPQRPSNLPHTAEERIDIRDLTWEDREKVLRLLFAKINNATPLHALPPHALQPDGGLPEELMGSQSDAGSPQKDLPPDGGFFVTQQPAVA